MAPESSQPHYAISLLTHSDSNKHTYYQTDFNMGDSSSPKPVSVLFVCLGNICANPSPAIH